LFCTVTERQAQPEERTQILASALEAEDPRFLLVLDNFETVDDPAAVFAFFNDHVTLPNRALITAREHHYSGDQVLPVVRMELPEAEQLLRQEAAVRGIGERLDDAKMRRIHEACAGNPYAMKLAVAQFTVTPDLERILRATFGRSDLHQALCQRAFAELDEWAGYLFLLLGQLRFDPLDSMLHIPAARHRFVMEEKRSDLLQRSLVEAGLTAGGERMLTMSELHQAFARQQLIGDVREPSVLEDARFLAQYRPGLRDPKIASLFHRLGDDMTLAHRAGRTDAYQELRAGLRALAVAEPRFLVEEAQFLQGAGEAVDEVRSSYKQSVEWRDDDVSVWLRWAAYERGQGDRLAELSVLASCAARFDGDLGLNLDLAGRIADAFNAAKQSMPAEERLPYLRSCRDNLERRRSQLDATGVSRLAWLFLLEGDLRSAREWTEEGLRLEASNSYLLNLSRLLRQSPA
jgi:hypothetical protein